MSSTPQLPSTHSLETNQEALHYETDPTQQVNVSLPPLTSEQLAMIEQFKGFVPHIVRQLSDFNATAHQIEQFNADGLEGLVRGVRSFDQGISDQSGSENGSAYIFRSIWGRVKHGQRLEFGRNDAGGVGRTKPSVTGGTADSLQSPVVPEDGITAELTLEETIEDYSGSESIESVVLAETTRTVISTLDPLDRQILALRSQGMSQTSIAEELGITSQPYVGRRLKHIRKVLQQALMSE